MTKLAIDAMSGDLGSSIVVEAIQMFKKEYKDVELTVVGKEEELTAIKDLDHVSIIDARDIVQMTDSVLALRRKKESSLFKAINLIKSNEADGLVSCGNTGAYYALSMLFVKRIEGLEKSCLMANMPTKKGGKVLFLDAGANVENTAEQLVQFAIMGSVYASIIEGKNNPRVGLLNNGTEEKKGTDTRKMAYQLLKQAHINFIGNVEGKTLLDGDVDVIVTDGFAGNIALKTIEGTANMVMSLMKETLMSSTKGKIGGLLIKNDLRSLKKMVDPNEIGGAMMMGFDHPIIKAHGGSNATAFYNAMILAKNAVEQNVVGKMAEIIAEELKEDNEVEGE